jgi:hypothetical protein
MAEIKNKTLVYKRCRFHKRSDADLESLLKAALKSNGTVGSRRQSLAPKYESPIWLVIAQHKSDSAFVFGLLVQYTPGTNPSFLVDDASAASLAVEHLQVPKTADGKDRQLLEAMLFFAVTGNHMVMMQSQALKSLQLERHLQWLLHESKQLEGDDTVKLDDHLPLQVRKKLEDAPIRSLTIGEDLAGPAEREEMQVAEMPRLVVGQSGEPPRLAVTTRGTEELVLGQKVVTSSVQVASSTGSPEVFEMLKGLVGPSQASKLNLDGIDGSNIEYSLQIRYKRTTTDDGQKFMNGLGSALRHAEGVDTKIRLVGGGSISGDELRLSGPVKITTVNGVPHPDDVFEAMRTWLLERVKSGEIGA